MFGQVTTHASLLARLSGGADKTAWNEFHERYAELIRSFARRQHVSLSDCDDVVQDVLLALTQAMPRFQYDPARGNFRGYLRTIVHHAVCKRFFQKPDGLPLREDSGLAAPPDPAVEAAWEEEWQQYHVRQAMKTVATEFNQADRVAFEQYALQARSASDVAESLGMTPEQVYQAKSRILKRVSELIRQQVAEEG